MAKTYETILLAAGSSRRLKEVNKTNKILKELNGRPVFDYSLHLFLKDTRCQTIWLVIKPGEKETISQLLKKLYNEIPQKLKWVEGGQERQDSVQKALEVMADDKHYVFVHDAARPFIDRKLIDELLDAVDETGAVTLGLPAIDSMKLVTNAYVDKSLHRPSVWHIQTPQAFSKSLLREAMSIAASEQFYGNEEGELVERLGHPVKVIKGYDRNFKITTQFDYQMAKLVSKYAEQEE